MSGVIKKIYSALYPVFPEFIQKHLTGSLYLVGIKPTVNRSLQRFPTGKAALVISADMELAWASRYSRPKKDYLLLAQRERKNIPVLLKLFDKYHIPITWAIVGHLFLDQCSKKNGKVHSELPRPDYFKNKNWSFEQGDWYDHDPAGNIKTSPEWYGKDLIRDILSSKVKHEIACHTFSHIDFSDINCNPELARAELQACKNLAMNEGIYLTSMVFPGATMGNFDILKEEGFISYRLETNYDIDLPYIDLKGLVVIPSSFMIGNSPRGKSKAKVIGVLKRYIDKAIQSKKLVHFWFHPSLETWYVDNIFPQLLSYISEKQQSGKLDVLTMKAVSEIVIKNEQEA